MPAYSITSWDNDVSQGSCGQRRPKSRGRYVEWCQTGTAATDAFTYLEKRLMGAFANPFDPDKLLWSGCPCGQHRSLLEHQLAMAKKSGSRFACETVNEPSSGGASAGHSPASCFDPNCLEPACVALRNSAGPEQQRTGQIDDEPDGTDMEETLARCVESAVI